MASKARLGEVLKMWGAVLGRRVDAVSKDTRDTVEAQLRLRAQALHEPLVRERELEARDRDHGAQQAQGGGLRARRRRRRGERVEAILRNHVHAGDVVLDEGQDASYGVPRAV